VALPALAGERLVRAHLPQGGQSAVAASIQSLGATLAKLYGAEATTGKVYVGSEFCIACHQEYASWRNTKHNQALKKPMPEFSMVTGKGMVNDYDRNGIDDFAQGLDFNTINSVFDPYKPNAPKLSLENGKYFITIGDLKMPVAFIQGGTGDWKQRWGVRIPVTDTPTGLSADIYMAPIQYNEKTKSYVLYNAGNWYDSNNQPIWKAGMTSSQIAQHKGSYSKNCIGCHATGIRELKQNAAGEWVFKGYVAVLEQEPSTFDYDGDGNNDLVNVGCEACHGPGSAHILAGGDPSKIVNPEKLTTQEANEICGQCHIRVTSVPNGTHEWPYRDDIGKSWIPGSGERLEDYYHDHGGYWPDGMTSKQHHQQFEDFYRSSKPTFQFHPVRCSECHDPHGTSKHQIRTEIRDGNLVIPTANDNNTLCLACHATHGPFASITKEEVAAYEQNKTKIGEVVAAHTHHPYGPERSMGLSRCSKCHMATMASSAVAYDIHSHTFEVTPPEKTLKYQDQGGMPNGCAVSCHATKVNSFGLGYDPSISTWNADFDKKLATELMKYLGPNGLWWQVSLTPQNAPDNPSYQPPAEND